MHYTLSKKTVYCIVPDAVSAQKIMDELLLHGFSKQDISLLLPEKAHPTESTAEIGKTLQDISKIRDESAKTVRIQEWMEGLSTVNVTGSGCFFVTGPIVSALNQSNTGVSDKKIARCLEDLGVPRMVARRYEGMVQTGNILFSVYTRNSDLTDLAIEIFNQFDAMDTFTTGVSYLSVPGNYVFRQI